MSRNLRWWSVLLLITVTTVSAQEKPKNVILMIADGYGPASATMARDFLRATTDQESLAMDAFLVGSSRTHPTDSHVTDSAAGATAFSCGIKTYNGAISVDTLQVPCPTVLEAAENLGLATGLVATSRITHATPAAFSSHVSNRNMESEIAAQQLLQNMEVILGGGSNFYLPTEAGGKRSDGRNLLDEAQRAGYSVIRTRSEFDSISKENVPLLGLFAPDHMAYEIDRDPATQPSLAEMTLVALDVLSRDPDGFFLMIEGSRIDHAAHGNDPIGHVHDILAYDEALAAVIRFAEEEGKTLVISTADHETGGLSLGRNNDNGQGVYDWHPDVLATFSSSLESGGQAVLDGTPVFQVLEDQIGLNDISDEERNAIMVEYAEMDQAGLARTVQEMINKRVGIGWSTTGHSAVDVNIYAFGPGSDFLIGNHENTDIGKVIIEQLGLDMKSVNVGTR